MKVKKFGRLTVLRVFKIEGRDHCEAECVCGSTPNKVYRLRRLLVGSTKSCGCYRREISARPEIHNTVRHGHRANGHSSRTYVSYRSMIQRCYDSNATGFKYWGGRGIKVCARWRGRFGFMHFVEDMGLRPPATSLDRFPNKSGHYSKLNCRWANRCAQQNNLRRQAA